MVRLSRWLDDNSLTQAEFGRRIKVSQATISDWITGATSPSLDNLREVSRETGLSFDELLGVGAHQTNNKLARAVG